MAAGDLTVEFAPGDTIFTASKTWVDISAYARSVATRRGRSNELDDFQAGSCSIVLDNSGRLFDPLYSGGTYYGDLKPGVPVRVSVNDGTSDVPVFTGAVHSWPQEFDAGNTDATVTVQASDAFRWLNRGRIEGSDLGVELDEYWPLNDAGLWAAMVGESWWGRWAKTPEHADIEFESGATFTGTVFDGSQRMTAYVTGSSGDPWFALVEVDTSADLSDGQKLTIFDRSYLTFLFGSLSPGRASLALEIVSTDDKTCRIWGKRTSLGAVETSETFRYDQPLAIGVDFLTTVNVNGTSYSLDSIAGSTPPYAGEVVWVGDSYDSNDGGPFYGTIAMVGWDESGSPDLAGAWNTISGSTVSGAKVGAVLDLVSWPAADRDIDTGLTDIPALGYPADPLGALKLIETTEQGALFVSKSGDVVFQERYATHGASVAATFSDDGSDYGYLAGSLGFDFDDTLIVNECTVSSPVAGTHTASEGTSPVYSESLSAWSNTPGEAMSLAEYRLLRFSEPQVRARAFQIRPESDPTIYPDLLGLELRDLIRLERTPQGVGSQIAQDLIVEGIAWSASPGDVVVTLHGSPPDPNEDNYGRFDTGVFDTALFAY